MARDSCGGESWAISAYDIIISPGLQHAMRMINGYQNSPAPDTYTAQSHMAFSRDFWFLCPHSQISARGGGGDFELHGSQWLSRWFCTRIYGILLDISNSGFGIVQMGGHSARGLISLAFLFTKKGLTGNYNRNLLCDQLDLKVRR
jgi:hypothetical protein